jgi:putative oxidoreductase
MPVSSATLADPPTSSDAGRLLLRLAIGVLILMHGIAKIGSGPGSIIGMLTNHGLPGAFGYLVYVGEVLAPLLLIVGAWTRIAALIVAVNMVVAIALAHSGDLLSIGKTGGWAIELQGLYLFGALAIALLGAGRYSAGGISGRFN